MKNFFKKIFKYFFIITITVLLIGITTDQLLGVIILICGIVVLCFCAVIDLLFLYDKIRKPTPEELAGRVMVEEFLQDGEEWERQREKQKKEEKLKKKKIAKKK